MNVDLAIELSKLVHNECKDVPHDIGIRLIRIVEKHEEAMDYTHCCTELKDKEVITFEDWLKDNCEKLHGAFYRYKENVLDRYDMRYVYMRECKQTL
jgi:hypothetical protein